MAETPGNGGRVGIKPHEVEALADSVGTEGSQIAGTRVTLDRHFEAPVKYGPKLRDAFPDTAPLADSFERIRYAVWESLREAVHATETFADGAKLYAYNVRLDDEAAADEVDASGKRWEA